MCDRVKLACDGGGIARDGDIDARGRADPGATRAIPAASRAPPGLDAAALRLLHREVSVAVSRSLNTGPAAELFEALLAQHPSASSYVLPLPMETTSPTARPTAPPKGDRTVIVSG